VLEFSLLSSRASWRQETLSLAIDTHTMQCLSRQSHRSGFQRMARVTGTSRVASGTCTVALAARDIQHISECCSRRPRSKSTDRHPAHFAC
jgi:hypothetical protein